MPRPLSVLTAAVLALSLGCHAQGTASATPGVGAGTLHPTTPPPSQDVNPQVLKLVVEDQWDRGNDMFGKGMVRAPKDIDWKLTAAHDAIRHQAVRQLLAAGKLKTSSDFEYASLIFQHSSDPADLMLAHLLSSTAVSMGGTGKWMMAATLDRYLHSIKQPQIFGTQFLSSGDGHTLTMEPYNRSTLTDAERALWCVVPLAEQEKLLENQQKLNSGNFSTTLPGCK